MHVLMAFLLQFYLNYLELNYLSLAKKLSCHKPYLVREREGKEASKKEKGKG